MKKSQGSVNDPIDVAARQWEAVWPELDVAPSEVLGRIHRISTLLEEAQNRWLRRRRGMAVSNLGDFELLRTLRRAAPPAELTPTQLRREMLVSAAGLTGRLKRLEVEGWIERIASPQDGRSALVRLTAAGTDDLDRTLPEHFRFEAGLLKALTATERDGVATALRELLLDIES